jgi:glucosamine--fructose-6-phosphate aminotransferase (isomerizing)
MISNFRSYRHHHQSRHILATSALALSLSAYYTQYNKSNNISTLNEHSTAINKINQIKIQTIETLTNDTNNFAACKPYFTLTKKEIMEQPKAISKALQFGATFSYGDYGDEVVLNGLSSNIKFVQEIKDLIITGCGTSLNAGLYAQKLMQYVQSFDTVRVIDSALQIAAVTDTRGPALDAAGLLAISSQHKNFAVVNAEHQQDDTFTSQVTVLSLLAAWFSQLNNEDRTRAKQLTNALHKLHTYVGGVIRHTKAQCIQIASVCHQLEVENVFILGKGFGECIAYEAALKMKEITHMQAEGYSDVEGVCAGVDENGVVIVIVLDDEYGSVLVENAREIEARGCKVVYITDNKELLAGLSQERIIAIPGNGPLTALLAVVPLQMIAYYIAMAKGVNVNEEINEEL